MKNKRIAKCLRCGGDMIPNDFGEHYSWAICAMHFRSRIQELEKQVLEVTNQRNHFLNIANMYGTDLAKLNAYGDKDESTR
jgi:hypothetical protein